MRFRHRAAQASTPLNGYGGSEPCAAEDARHNFESTSLAGRPYRDALPRGTIVVMALQPLSATELADTRTLFASFMGYIDHSYKTFGQLLAIYRERSETLHAAADWADDLRVGRFKDDMAGNRWNADVVVRIGVFDDTLLVIDGIHRGIAYLTCITEGISPDRLPALQVNC
jgi:hypothetical protein